MTRPTLCGDWFGSRTHLAESGFNFSVSTTQYFQGVVDGGLNQTSRYGGRNDILMNVDGEKAGLWKGLFITVHGESRYSESVIQDTGSMLPANLGARIPAALGHKLCINWSKAVAVSLRRHAGVCGEDQHF